MEKNELSFESLYSRGLGIPSNDESTFIGSRENYDGYEDAEAIELAHSVEALDFIDAYSKIERKAASDKIRMCKKIAVNYGLKSGLNATAANSVESLCRIQSLEADSAAVAAGADSAQVADKPKTDAPAKKQGFFKTIFAAIKKVFIAIGNFFKKIWDKITKFFSGIFKKAPPKDVDIKVVEQVATAAAGTAKEEAATKKYAVIAINGSGQLNSYLSKCDSIYENIVKYNEVASKGQNDAAIKQLHELNKQLMAASATISGSTSTNVLKADLKEDDKAIAALTGVTIVPFDPKNKKIFEFASKERSVEASQKAFDSLKTSAKTFTKLNEKCIKLADKCETGINVADNDSENKAQLVSQSLRSFQKILRHVMNVENKVFSAMTFTYSINIKSQKDIEHEKIAKNGTHGTTATGTIGDKLNAVNAPIAKANA
jgi:hypothetical protein